MKSDFVNMVLTPLRAAFDNNKSSGKLVKTNWTVITGAPLSGKTTVIKKLHSLGYGTTPDFGRIAIEKRIKQGENKISARENYRLLQEEISNLQNTYLEQLDPSRLIFLDYGPADNLAFLFYNNKEFNQLLIDRAAKYQINHCFLLDPLDASDTEDPVRVETNRAQIDLKGLIEEVYTCLNVAIMHIENAEVDVRLAKILAYRMA